jgi:fructose transport system ATP-binding protein
MSAEKLTKKGAAKRTAAVPKAKTIAKPAIPDSAATVSDNLLLIKGIGPVNDRKLRQHGISSFAQIASWKAADIISIEKYLEFDGRIAREDWIGQASALGKAVKAKAVAEPAAAPKVKMVAKPATKPVRAAAAPKAKAAVKPAAILAMAPAAPKAKVVAKSAAKPVKAAAAPIAKAFAKPAEKPIAASKAKVVSKPAAKPVKTAAAPKVKAAAKPEAKPIADPKAKAVAKPAAKPIKAPAAPKAKAAVKPVSTSAALPAAAATPAASVSAPASEPILSTRGLFKRYGTVVALNGADFDLYPGEILAVIGDNGAGKTTLIKALTGAVTPDHGEIKLEGETVHFRSPQDARNAGIETVYQNLALSPALSIAENMFLGRERLKPGIMGSLFRSVDRAGMEKFAREKLSELGLMTIQNINQAVETLSGGQRQGVAVARAAAFGSKVVIMDEPTAALGVKESRRVLELILDVQKRGMPIVLISHNMPHVFEVADRIHIHRLGKRLCTIKSDDFSMSDAVAFMTGAKEPPRELMAA